MISLQKFRDGDRSRPATPDSAPAATRTASAVTFSSLSALIRSAGLAEMDRGPAMPAAQAVVAAQSYGEIAVTLEPADDTYWCFMQPQGRPSFTPGLLGDLARMQGSIRRLFAERADEAGPPFRYFVVGSHTPGIFNLGGDLGLFIEKIRNRDRVGLRSYAHACVEVVYNNAVGYDQPIVTIALVQGDALGGGFEAALSCNLIVAEKSAKFGLPEVLFNLFPGMGAYSLLARRLDAVRAERLILSGKVYSAAELFEMGIVDVLVDDGEGEEAVRAYIERHRRRHNAQAAVYRAGRRVNPLSLEELRDITDLWVEAALRLTESDLRKMARLTGAQDRRRNDGAMALAAE